MRPKAGVGDTKKVAYRNATKRKHTTCATTLRKSETPVLTQ